MLVAGMVLVPLVPAHAQYFGAVSFSASTGAQGWGIDFARREEAEEAAFQNCAKYANDCQVVAWIKDGCVAIAMGSTQFATGWNSSKALAEKQAMDECKKVSNRCTVARWVCTTNSQF